MNLGGGWRLGGAGAEGLGFLACGAEERLHVAACGGGLELQGTAGGTLQARDGGDDKGVCVCLARLASARRDHAAGGAVLGVVCGHDGVCFRVLCSWCF